MSGWGLGGMVWRGGGGREGRRGIIPVGWKGKYRVMIKKLEPMAIFFTPKPRPLYELLSCP